MEGAVAEAAGKVQVPLLDRRVPRSRWSPTTRTLPLGEKVAVGTCRSSCKLPVLVHHGLGVVKFGAGEDGT